MALPQGYRVRKVNIQDPRYGSPNYRYHAISPEGENVSRLKHGHFNRAQAEAAATEHLSKRQFGGAR